MSVFESALADGNVAAHSPERTIRHIPFLGQLFIIYTNPCLWERDLLTCAPGENSWRTGSSIACGYSIDVPHPLFSVYPICFRTAPETGNKIKLPVPT